MNPCGCERCRLVHMSGYTAGVGPFTDRQTDRQPDAVGRRSGKLVPACSRLCGSLCQSVPPGRSLNISSSVGGSGQASPGRARPGRARTGQAGLGRAGLGLGRPGRARPGRRTRRVCSGCSGHPRAACTPEWPGSRSPPLSQWRAAGKFRDEV